MMWWLMELRRYRRWIRSLILAIVNSTENAATLIRLVVALSIDNRCRKDGEVFRRRYGIWWADGSACRVVSRKASVRNGDSGKGLQEQKNYFKELYFLPYVM